MVVWDTVLNRTLPTLSWVGTPLWCRTLLHTPFAVTGACKNILVIYQKTINT